MSAGLVASYKRLSTRKRAGCAHKNYLKLEMANECVI